MELWSDGDSRLQGVPVPAYHRGDASLSQTAWASPGVCWVEGSTLNCPALGASAAVFSSSAVVIKQVLRKGRFDHGHAREG